MADSSPPAGLSDRAAQILKLVGELADAIRANEHSSRDETLQQVASAWKSLFPAIVELGETLPAEPDPVTDWIREVSRVSKWFDDAARQHGLADVLFRFNCDGFLRVEEEGRALLNDMAANQDAFAVVDVEPVLSLLDRYPATPAGHVAFLEMVRDEIQYAADAKRQQFAKGYSFETLARMVCGIKWVEAGQRLSVLFHLAPDAANQAASVLQTELKVGTVERIDELFTPVVRDLRDALEQSRIEARNAAEGGAVAKGIKPAGQQKSPATVNERMAGTIMEKPEAMGWNSPQWAKFLKCGKSSVVETATWKILEIARLQAKAERMNDRRRKPKASDSKRD
ncbi:MAG: hypothetical protein O3C34_16325 [Proteobacteria bacterium]|nr:hypothetical protein [Pseudomonadota bacterium]